MSFRRIAALVGAGFLLTGLCDAHAAQRPFAVDDLFRLEPLTKYVAISPDEQLIAFMRKRPIASDPENHYMWTNDRSDVWIYDRRSGSARNLTRGQADRSDFWYPVWSPSGNQLAMVSTRNSHDHYAQVWIWDRRSGELSQFSDRHVDIENGSDVAHASRFTVFWMSDSTLVFPTIPEGVRPRETVPTRQEVAEVVALWERKSKGVEPSTAVYDSGLQLDRNALSLGETFVSCEVKARRCTDVVAAGMDRPGFEGRGLPTVLPSPDDRLVAVGGLTASLPPDPKHIEERAGTLQFGLYLFDREHELKLPALATLANVVPGSYRWSPDGKRLAFFSDTLQILDVARGTLTEVPISGLDAAVEVGSTPSSRQRFGLLWSGTRNLVLQAKGSAGTGWWRLDGKRTPRNLASTLGFVPQQLYPIRDGTAFACVGRGNLWEITSRGDARKVTHHSPAATLSVLWTDASAERGKPGGRFVYQVSDAGSRSFYFLDLANGQPQRIVAPSERADFASFAPRDRYALFMENDRTGNRLWLSAVDAPAPILLVETNTFLREIAQGEVREMSYTSLGGEPYRAWLVLPIDFRPERKYPLVVWVYPIPQPEQQPELTSIATLNALNLQVLAARGYAVLLPSMPGAAARYDRLLDGVLPAIDKAIASGIADPERLAVMGQSYGGFSTYGLISLTTRFKAAAALAGMTDWTALALGFNPSLPATRPYRNALGVSAGRLNGLEFGFQYGLPWRSTAYAMNSPLMYVDRVQTPLLMLHGDFDGAMVQQAEEFYTALERLGKRSRLVKYFGDDHVLQSPANIKDSWRQVLSWFDEYCDVTRDNEGSLVFDGDRVRSRRRAGLQ